MPLEEGQQQHDPRTCLTTNPSREVRFCVSSHTPAISSKETAADAETQQQQQQQPHRQKDTSKDWRKGRYGGPSFLLLLLLTLHGTDAHVRHGLRYPGDVHLRLARPAPLQAV